MGKCDFVDVVVRVVEDHPVAGAVVVAVLVGGGSAVVAFGLAVLVTGCK